MNRDHVTKNGSISRDRRAAAGRPPGRRPPLVRRARAATSAWPGRPRTSGSRSSSRGASSGATRPGSTRPPSASASLAFTWVTQAPGTVSSDLTPEFAAIPEIEECHYIAGEADYILKIRARDMDHLGRDRAPGPDDRARVLDRDRRRVQHGLRGPAAAARRGRRAGPRNRAARGRVRRWRSAGSGDPDEAALVRAVAGGIGGCPRGALRPARRRRPCRRAPAHERPAGRRGGRAGDVPGALEPRRAVRSGGRVARDVAADDRPQPDRRPAAGRGPAPAAGPARGPRGRRTSPTRRLRPAAGRPRWSSAARRPDPGPEAAAEAADLRAAVGAALADDAGASSGP